MVDVVNGLPVPSIRRKGPKTKYPFYTMEPGQAFKFEEGMKFSSATSYASQQSRGTGKKFAVRLVGDEVWCWRIDGMPYEVPNGNYAPKVKVVSDYAERAGVAQQTAVVGDDAERRRTPAVVAEEDVV